MKVNEIQKTEKTEEKFYIVDQLDLYNKEKEIKVMCSTLAGFKFFSINRTKDSYNDSVDVMEYFSYNDADLVLREHYANTKSLSYVKNRKLSVLSVKTDSTISTTLHPAVMTDDELEKQKLFDLMYKFEEVYIKLQPSWTLHAMSTRRHETEPEYYDVNIQKAFSEFVKFYSVLNS